MNAAEFRSLHVRNIKFVFDIDSNAMLLSKVFQGSIYRGGLGNVSSEPITVWKTNEALHQ